MNGFQKCSNGHYYPKNKEVCPYCPGNSTEESKKSSEKPTEDYSNVGVDDKTQVYGGGFNTPDNDQDKTVTTPPPSKKQNTPKSSTSTIFVDDIETEKGVSQETRKTRRLVGWLVSYSMDPMGIDFKVYEGRNTIGRDITCNITVEDGTITGKHATILFRNGKYKIKDEMSTHGTFVNDNDIEDDQFDLDDGDMIKIGQTIFKFRTSF